MKLLRFINDMYKVDNIKNMTRKARGTSSTKFNITGFEQNTPQSDSWQELLNDNEYKDQLIEMINSMYWSSVPEFYQDLFLLLLLRKKKIVLFSQQEIKS